MKVQLASSKQEAEAEAASVREGCGGAGDWNSDVKIKQC